MFCSFIVVKFFSEFWQLKRFKLILQYIFIPLGATKYHTLHFEMNYDAFMCEYGMDYAGN